MSLNSHYMTLFKNPRDASQFANPARQMYPKTSIFAVEAYKDATKELFTGRPASGAGRRSASANQYISREKHYVYVSK